MLCVQVTYQSPEEGAGGPAGSDCPSTAAPHKPDAHPTLELKRPPCCHFLWIETVDHKKPSFIRINWLV